MSNPRVLVTGSSRGIGRAIALRLAKQGWRVAVHCQSNVAQADETLAALGDAASGAYQCDLASPALVGDLMERVLGDGPLDALVNNAGIYRHMDFVSCPDEEFERDAAAMFAVNFESPMRLARLACKVFRDQGHGKIVNVASRVGFKGEAGAALYAASKAALINLTRSLATELAPHIQVFAITPGWVETAMVRKDVEVRLASILDTIPMGRMASPEDCAGAVAYLLSSDAEYLSGIALDINGASYFH